MSRVRSWADDSNSWAFFVAIIVFVLIGSYVFDHAVAGFYPEEPGVLWFIDGATGGATVYSLVSPSQLHVSERFTLGALISFGAAICIALLHRKLSQKSMSFAQTTCVWLITYLAFALGMVAYLLFVWLTQNTITVRYGNWAFNWAEMLQTGLLVLVTLVAAELIFPRTVDYSSHD